MRKLLKKTAILFGVLLGIPLIYLLIAVVLSVIPNQKNNTSGDEIIYLVSNGVHTDLVFEKATFLELNDLGVLSGSNDLFLAIGWGDRGFYLDTPSWSELTLKTAVNAAFLKGETLIHITRYKSLKTKWKKVKINEQQMAMLKAYVLAHFKRESNRVSQVKNAHYGKFDEFYEAKGNYSIFKTCNTWVNIALKNANIKTAIWTPFDFGIMRWYD